MGFLAPAWYLGGWSAYRAVSVDAREFAEYERRSDTPQHPAETGAADPIAPSGASTAAPVVGL